MTTKEAAEMAGVSTTMVKRWIACGRLKAERVGARAFDVDEASLMALLAAPRVRGPDKRPRAKQVKVSVGPSEG